MDDHLQLDALTIVASTFDMLDQVAHIADQVATAHTLDDYQARLSRETERRQRCDLALFARFFRDEVKIELGDLYQDLVSWRNVSFGIVEGFKRWQLAEGYAIGSINVRLATIKAYCKLAHDAGVLTTENYVRIAGVKGFKRTQGRNVDEKRTQTRKGSKKARAVQISPVHMELLKKPADGFLGARDALLMCLLLEHGLRVSEVTMLQVNDFDLATATMTVYRHKVDKTDTHELTPDTLLALQRYLATIPLAQASLFDNLATRTINARVRLLGERVGLQGLSPHDCRHACFTDAARNGTDSFAIQQAGGWTSIQTAARYITPTRIANKGMKLSSMRKHRGE